MTMAQICAMWRNDARRLRTRVSTRTYATDMARAEALEKCADELAQHLTT